MGQAQSLNWLGSSGGRGIQVFWAGRRSSHTHVNLIVLKFKSRVLGGSVFSLDAHIRKKGPKATISV